VIAIGPLAEDVQEQVDFAGRLLFKRHSKNANPEGIQDWRRFE
jgi:hypothetical protein